MSSVEHDRSILGTYVLGTLDPREAQLVHAHLAGCVDCRREVADLVNLRAALDEVPPEAFLDGPPDGGELLLQRTLRAARAELPPDLRQPERRGWPRGLVAASVIVVAAATLGGGVLLGRETAPGNQAAPTTTRPPNLRSGEATDPATQVQLAAEVTPQAGWVRVHATVRGVSAGEHCQLLVVPRNGEPILAGSWLVSENGAKNGTSLDGSALVNPDEVESVDVMTTDGRRLVSVPL